jgi:hypothetical protein
MKKFTFLTLFTLVCAVFSASAQDSTKSAPGELTISGYVDAYYTYNLNRPQFAKGISFDNAGRIFDVKHNQFALGLAQTKFSYTKGKLTGVVDLTFGPNAELGNFGNIYGSMVSIKQAYMDYSVTDKLKFTVGQFGTHIGYELIDAPLNFNYSLSYLFGNGPFYHTGAKVSYTVSDKIGLMAGVVNGWDSQFDFNKGKSFVAQVYLAPTDKWSAYLNYMGGDEKNGLSFPTLLDVPEVDSVKTPTHLFDLTTAYQVTDDFKIGLNAAYGTGKLDTTGFNGGVNGVDIKSASWYGAAVYLNYSVSDKFGLGLRAEHFNDEDGVRYIGSSFGTGVATTYNEFTLTGDIKLADGMFNIKPEIRLDVAGEDAFIKYDSDGVGEATNTQLTIGTAFIFKF